MSSVGNRIKEIRKRYGLSQEELSERLNTYRTRIVRIENGYIEPYFSEIINICKIFNTDIDFFITSFNLSSQDFLKISDRYIKNDSIKIDEKKEVVKKLFINLAEKELDDINTNVLNKNNYINKDIFVINMI